MNDFIAQLLEITQYTFLRRGLAVGMLVTLCAALLGVTLVLRHYSMIGDGLSHIGFGALAVAAAFQWAPLPVALPAVMLSAFLLLHDGKGARKLRGDAAVAIFSTSCLALGVLILSFRGGSNVDLMNYMFGSILSLTQNDLWLSLALSAVVLPGFLWFFHRIFSLTFDPSFARATGVKTQAYQLFTAGLTALTVVLGMRMMGTLLISSLMIFPALIAMRVCKSFRGVAVCAALVAAACFVIGFVLSCTVRRGLPTGATIVVTNLCAFGIFAVAGRIRWRNRTHCGD